MEMMTDKSYGTKNDEEQNWPTDFSKDATIQIQAKESIMNRLIDDVESIEIDKNIKDFIGFKVNNLVNINVTETTEKIINELSSESC
jgi:hypothetical protein